MRSRLTPLSVPLALGLLFGCGGSGSGSTGAMTVHVTDGPILGFKEINVHILRVEIRGEGGWTTLGTPDVTLNLLDLTGGVGQTLAAGATLPAGHYGQMRLVLGSGNTVKLADDSVHDLTVPSGLQSGIKLTVSFDVAAGTTKDVWIDFDAAHSIQVVAAGASQQYLLRPTVRAFDKVATGSISGTFTDAATGTPLAGAMVYAETLEGGSAAIVRSAVTDAAGHYLLDLLPTGGIYHVVSLPRTGSGTVTAYGAKASGPLAVTVSSPMFTFNTTFTAAAQVGGVGGGITPVATSSQHDAAELLQVLPVPGGADATFLVDGTLATVGTGTETYAFANLPVGTYLVRGRRTTLAPDGSTPSTTSATLPVTVASGATTTVNLTF
jgi:hypothetical protein